MCITWIFYVSIIPSGTTESWGPTEEKLQEACRYERTESVWNTADYDDSVMVYDSGNDAEDDDMLYWDSMDELLEETQVLDDIELDIIE